MSNKKILFFKVTSNGQKLQKIVEITKGHFENKEPLTILVPNENALDYIDELLWKVPATSFLPHSTEEGQTITIKVFSKEMALQKHIFNLCPFEILPSSFTKIYELEDTTSEAKQALFQKKINTYQKLNIPIESH
jgi:DNA polymerase IIIc chi subunit